MTSRETRAAFADAANAEAAWKVHVHQCVACMSAQGRRAWGELCSAGARARALHVEAKAVVKRERELDKAVPEGQESLF